MLYYKKLRTLFGPTIFVEAPTLGRVRPYEGHSLRTLAPERCLPKAALRKSAGLSIDWSIYLSIYLPILLSIYPSIYLSIVISISLTVYLSFYLSIYLSYLSVWLSVDRSICLSTIGLSIYLSVCVISMYPSMLTSVIPAEDMLAVREAVCRCRQLRGGA